MAWYEQQGGLTLKLDSSLTRVYISCFVVVIKKIEFWYEQFSHGQTAFLLCSRLDSFISPKSNLRKNKTSLVHVRLLSGIESESSAIFEHKNAHTMHFLFVFNFYLKKRRGNFWPPQFALWRPKIYIWSPVGAPIKKLISDPVNLKKTKLMIQTHLYHISAKISISLLMFTRKKLVKTKM